jgi:hypothetical protein
VPLLARLASLGTGIAAFFLLRPFDRLGVGLAQQALVLSIWLYG